MKYKYQANGTGRRRSRKRRPQHCSMCARSLPSYANSIVTASFHFLFGFVAVTRNVDGVKINDCLAPKRGNKELASLIGFCGGNCRRLASIVPFKQHPTCVLIFIFISEILNDRFSGGTGHSHTLSMLSSSPPLLLL